MKLRTRIRYWIFHNIFRRKYFIGIDLGAGKDETVYTVVRYKKCGDMLVEEILNDGSELYKLPKDLIKVMEKHPPDLFTDIDLCPTKNNHSTRKIT